jgi:hypothetical protein
MTGSQRGITLPAAFFLFAILAFVSLIPSLTSYFSPQDFMTFLNPLSRGDGFGSYMINGWSWLSDTGGGRIGFFRPLTSLTYMVEHPFWGSSPIPYRLVSLLVHAAACTVVMLIASRIRRGTVLLAGILAALTPGAMHAVWLINGRGDLLASLFFLLTVFSVIRLSEMKAPSTRQALLPALFCLLAMASKELGIASVAAAALTYIMLRGNRPDRKRFMIFSAGLAGVSLLYLAVRLAIFDGVGGYGMSEPVPRMFRNLLTLSSQVTGASMIPWILVRRLYTLIIAAPVVFFAFSSRAALKKTGLFLLLILLAGFQSIAGGAWAHYIHAPAMVFAVLLGVSLHHAAVRFGVKPVFAAAPLAVLWLVLGLGVSGGNSGIALPMEKVYGEAAKLYLGLVASDRTVCIVLDPEVHDDPLLSEVRNLPLYFDHIAGGRSRLETVFWSPDSPQPENGCIFLHWDGEDLHMLDSPPLDM